MARVVTAYFLEMALAPIPYGAMSDRWGRRPMLWLSGSVCQTFLMPTFNTLAPAPMADAAGSASALVATVTTAVGASLGAFVDAQFGDTVTPLAVAVVTAGVVVAALVAATLRGRAPVPAPA